MSIIINKEIDFLSQIVKCVSGININLIQKNNKEILNYIDNVTDNIFYSLSNSKINLEKMSSIDWNFIYQVDFVLDIKFIIFCEKYNRVFVLGPFLTTPFSKTEAIIKLSKYNLSQDISDKLISLCKRLSVIDESTGKKLAELFVNHFMGISLPFKKVKYFNSIAAYGELESYDTNDELLKMRQVEMRYETSTALTEAVKQGNFSLAVSFLSRFNYDSYNGIRNKSPLRNIQNYCIVINTQLRHALEECDIHPYLLDEFSNSIGIRIEQLTTVDEANNYIVEIIHKYCNLVKDHSYPDLKPLIQLTVTYIKSHLNDNITVKDTAKKLAVNANYLSNLFVKDMKMTFSQFVNRERVIQAAALLKNTNLQIQEIASFVGYNNISYFARQFMKIYKKSPSEYRNQLNI